ncbi:hypothetical protein GCM10011494_11520 [Novosphingobium endophyticum]|uniref:Uncharacterized protein n=1 Tax=Novosphingobium endophyticum TaxID=1955250 RepID=A0A916X3N8_9SPHN|nr:hypothetical protein [Novosphingobium endophyticum]GGB94729.1 hypothetical protein GCM10011494_11520 [Novosphingobium endophyticum]
MDIHKADDDMRAAHAEMGGLIARCSLLEYRVGQFMARWFCANQKQKFLSFTLKAMPFTEKRQIIEERLSQWHKDPRALRETMTAISALLERRNLVASGVLSRRSSGALCIKSFSGARFISDEGAVDIIDIAELATWSEAATELSERLMALGQMLTAAEGRSLAGN